MFRALPRCLLSLVSALLAACALVPADPQSSTTTTPVTPRHNDIVDDDARWFQSCFRMPFDAQGKPVWATDLVISDRVLSVVLDAHREHIQFWRFHRRAAPDAAGHQLSLIVYAPPTSYASITTAIDAHSVLATLRSQGYLNEVQHDCRHWEDPTDVAATSDQSWSPEVQRAWPYFIMGVSANWLALVQAYAVELESHNKTLPEVYSSVEESMAELWARHAQHAYFHHLSAVFGYKPMLLQKWIQF